MELIKITETSIYVIRVYCTLNVQRFTYLYKRSLLVTLDSGEVLLLETFRSGKRVAIENAEENG